MEDCYLIKHGRMSVIWILLWRRHNNAEHWSEHLSSSPPREEDGLDSLRVSGGPRHIDDKLQCWFVTLPFKMLYENRRRNNEEQCEKMNSCGSWPVVKKSKMSLRNAWVTPQVEWTIIGHEVPVGEAEGSRALALRMLSLWKMEPSWNCVNGWNAKNQGRERSKGMVFYNQIRLTSVSSKEQSCESFHFSSSLVCLCICTLFPALARVPHCYFFTCCGWHLLCVSSLKQRRGVLLPSPSPV